MSFKENWRQSEIGKEIELSYGKGLTKRDRKEGDYPVYGSNGITDYHDDYLIEAPGIIVGRKGTIGKVEFTNKNFWPIDTTYYVNLLNEKNHFKFWYYFLESFPLEEMNSHSAVPGLNREQVYKLKCFVPPLREQKEISKILSSLDEKIENNKKINKNLEEMAQAIYKSWFVDFEPFQDRKFVESELGMIPEGWEVGNLGDKNLTKLVRGSINEFVGEKIYLATADVNDKKIEDYNTIITYDEKPSRANRKPEPNTIWFAKMRNSKKLILVSEYNKFLINNIILSTGFMGLDVQEYALYYIWNFINNEDFEEKKDKLCTGTTMEAINMTNTKKIKILIPSKEILDKFNSLMEPIYKKINNNKVETRNLKELRDSLLPKLMSGEIRVPLEKDEREVN